MTHNPAEFLTIPELQKHLEVQAPAVEHLGSEVKSGVAQVFSHTPFPQLLNCSLVGHKAEKDKFFLQYFIYFS